MTGTSKDIEKQIQGIQEDSEKIKGEVCQSMVMFRIGTLTFDQIIQIQASAQQSQAAAAS